MALESPYANLVHILYLLNHPGRNTVTRYECELYGIDYDDDDDDDEKDEQEVDEEEEDYEEQDQDEGEGIPHR